MYDVNFGGIERMTKRFTIALVALALFVLVAVMPVSAYYYTVAPGINQGASIFVGEQGLNLTPAVSQAATGSSAPASTTVGWWASAAQVLSTAPTKSIDVAARASSLTVNPADFGGYAGNWYLVDTTTGFAATKGTTPVIVFVAVDPTLDLRIWDATQNSDVTGKSIPQGEVLTFRIDTNMYQALSPTARFVVTNLNGNAQSVLTAVPGVGDGYIDIKVKDESGAVRTRLFGPNSSLTPLTAQNVSTSGWFWGTSAPFNAPGAGNWSTDALDTSGQFAYPSGTYTIWAESLLNNMKDNYRNAGADYTGKTVSQTYTVSIVSDTVKIEANKDTVVRSKPFSVTITGKPSTTYHVWVKGTSTMSGGFDDQPPTFTENQAGVTFDSPSAAFTAYRLTTDIAPNLLTAGGYQFQNGGDLRVIDDVSNTAVMGFGTKVEVNVGLSSSGTRTVELSTTNQTKAQRYTIRVEQNFGGQIKSDEVDVNVEKGAVTIVAAGDQSYYLGEEIKFSGTNTETQKTYLFIIGPNLPTVGAQIEKSDPRNYQVQNGVTSTFKIADVLGDNTWSWKWGTANYALDAGTYTIYAVSGPADRDHLDNVAYGTVSIIIKKPFVSATASQSTVAQGDNVFITGTAEGNPSRGIQIWILGKNFAVKAGQSVNSDASFSYEVKKTTTAAMYAGQYFVVVQHPMQNNQFDVDSEHATKDNSQSATNSYDNWVVNRQLQSKIASTGTAQVYRWNNTSGLNELVTITVPVSSASTQARIFKLEGAGSLQGSDAAEALVEGINDANVDDTYTKLQFLVEVPVIRIDPIGDKHVGDKFTITATTNLAVDDEILVEVYSSSFKPTQKSQSGEFSGATGTVKVTKGDSGLNKISFDIDSSTFKPDEYLVQENAVLQQATGTALFNVLEGVAPTVAPVVTVTTVAPTATPTTIVPTATPTPTPTKSPGYGALIALIGLGAVAFIVVRRH
jgi:PGF-CTERM protein